MKQDSADAHDTTTMDADHKGATVVITHGVRQDAHAQYERWLDEIATYCRASAGYLDTHVIRPIPGLTETFTVLIRFDTEANLRAWMESSTRTQLVKRVQPLFMAGDSYAIRSGLDFLFAPASAGAKAPVRWKQYLVTWSAIYPLALLVPMLVAPVLSRLGAADSAFLGTALVTGVVVFLMVYAVMPRYTKLLQAWLYR
jgi:antibiotic biosynthesis monooxygenase (ABM) superfamily enzyme